jgi:hypothetical protein
MKQKSNQPLEPYSLGNEHSFINRYKVSLNNILYQINIGVDGDSWCALIGSNVQDGIAGFGYSIHEALHNLADNIYKAEQKHTCAAHDISVE